jgi:hypothetical protein
MNFKDCMIVVGLEVIATFIMALIGYFITPTLMPLSLCFQLAVGVAILVFLVYGIKKLLFSSSCS